jgi:uncharacterized membrane protein HdeD (DUF308 family)
LNNHPVQHEDLTRQKQMARWFVITGIILIAAGLLLHFVPGAFNWLGRLPGDIRIETGKTKIYIPITTMIIISLILTLIVRVLRH